MQHINNDRAELISAINQLHAALERVTTAHERHNYSEQPERPWWLQEALQIKNQVLSN